MTSNDKILEAVAGYFKREYPGMTAEAVICFMILSDLGDQARMYDIGVGTGMTWEEVYQHMMLMKVGNGAGLVAYQQLADGHYMAILTDKGKAARDALQQSVPVG
ncbi:hypothetical protein KFE96_07395 [Kordiimonas sp. SCSIO 12603]|uniref:hypothetical protein n=1 Tax=Kordiimonas sp. SCSIO 12603 TaxID=2829596 RepID=UPI00210202F2|nr:hypothetical protein [Kordiimonas sp. SCSIO 12603]UTW60126.1 hypothetical protein KFE96_07395 [Kordiimonas sp. SCSIO 12603]